MAHNYGEIIEYIDGTRDEYFESGKAWAETHKTSFDEIISSRDLPKRYFQIGAEHVPTHDEVSELRKEYRKSTIDDKTLERQRKTANGTWTSDDEQEYLELDAEVTAWIEKNLPYPKGA